MFVFRDLIEYHVRTGKPVTQSSGAILLNPISRPDWQLDNRDVILLEKIGQVSFLYAHSFNFYMSFPYPLATSIIDKRCIVPFCS